MSEFLFRDKNILLISPENWSHLFVSKHHYAIELAKLNSVYYLNPPTNGFSVAKSAYDNLWVVNYTPFIKGLRFLPRFMQVYFMKKKFTQLEKLTAIKFDCVWSFDNSVFFDFSFLQNNILKISHIVDFSQNFQLSKATSTADICFGVSPNIVKRMKRFNKNCFLIPHGISIEPHQTPEIKFPGVNKIKVVYAGNLNSTLIDVDRLFQLLDSKKDIDFVFIGFGGEGWKKRNNVYKVGAVPHPALMGYLESADVLLMIYDSLKYPEQLTNAHKLLEYLYAGKIVVTNFISDYADKRHLIQMTDDSVDIFEIFDQTINNLEYYNHFSRVLERKQFALRNTYAHRLEEIGHLITKYFSGEQLRK
jgi:hypothetical protein